VLTRQDQLDLLPIDDLHEVAWNKQAFDHLVLDANYKKVILALTEANRASNDETFDDFIHGKGQGLVILLHGASGAGKTLTAET
jgi:hypothetical protein